MKAYDDLVAIETFIVESEIISAREYLDLYAARPHLIESTSIVPPRLGEDSDAFGRVQVRYSRPIYKALTAD